MEKAKWQMLLSTALIILSIILYFVHFLIFNDSKMLFYYFLSSLAFLPIEVLLVTIILHKLLNEREKKAMMQKLNMVIGIFFSEVGKELLASCLEADPDLESVRSEICVDSQWNEAAFERLYGILNQYPYSIDADRIDIIAMCKLLLDKKDFLIKLMENPVLLEHETFTDLLMAVFHLMEELSSRKQLDQLSDKDREHIILDIRRAYGLLAFEWAQYMKHLKKNYPFLFSFAMRTNPFDAGASPEIKN